MKTIRVFGAATAVALVAAVPLSMGAAVAAEPVTGVGSGVVSSTLLNVELGADGALLSVRVLGDDSTSTTDPADGEVVSSNALSPLTITSTAVPALNFALPSIGTTSKGDRDVKEYDPDTVSTPVASGALNAVLSSVVDAAGARSGLQAGLANLSLAGGLVNVPTGAVQLVTDAAPSAATGSRNITVPAINVLELDAVLEGLGISLLDLPVGDLLALLDVLGLDLADIDDPAAVVAALNAVIDTLQDQTGEVTAELCAEVDALLAEIGGITGLTGLDDSVSGITGTVEEGTLPLLSDDGTSEIVPGTITTVTNTLLSGAALPADISCEGLTMTVEELLDAVQDLLTETLSGVLIALDGAPLLSVSDVRIDILGKATDSVDTSVADVVASIGSVNVGGLQLAKDLDLTAPIVELNAVTELVNNQVGSVLAVLNASLADLVNVELLKITESVTADGDVVKALAEVVGVRATLTPPSILGAAGLLDATNPVSDVLADLGGAVPVLSTTMGQLEAVLGGVEALSGPSTVTVASVQGVAQFRPVAASSTDGPTPAGQLPRTGGDAVPAVAVAALLAGAAIGIRRITTKVGASHSA